MSSKDKLTYIFKELIKGVLGGIILSFGIILYYYSKTISFEMLGSLFFGFALFLILELKASLFTGKIGFMIDNHKKLDFLALILCLIGNLIGVVLISLLSFSTDFSKVINVVDNMYISVDGGTILKDTNNIISSFVSGIFAGMLVHIAVFLYKKYDGVMKFIVVIVPVSVMILCSFAHSIVYSFLFFLDLINKGFNLWNLLMLIIIILGNSVGGLLFQFINNKFLNQNIVNK
jgi:formate/nitrite transporter FocA (FNT family)